MGKISVHVSGRDRESRSREVSARLRVREKFVAGMWSREFCHVQHVGTRHICQSDHMYFSPVQQTTTWQLAAYCVHCFLRQCMRALTMAPPTPPTSFVSQGFRGQRLFGWPFGGLWFWHSLTFLTSGPCCGKAEKQWQVLPGRVHFQRPRPREAAPTGSEIEPRGGQNDLLEAWGSSWGGSWAPDGRPDRSGTAPGRRLGRSGPQISGFQ